MKNSSDYLGSMSANDNCTNDVIIGKTRDTYIGYLKLIPIKYKYSLYITKIGWDT